MGASLPLQLPGLVVVSEYERLPDDVFEHDQTFAVFVEESILANEDVLCHGWVCNPKVIDGLEVEGENWELFPVKFLSFWSPTFSQEVCHRDPFLWPTDRLRAHIRFLIVDHVPRVPKEEASTARVKHRTLPLVEAEVTQCSHVQADDDQQVNQGRAEADSKCQPK